MSKILAVDDNPDLLRVVEAAFKVSGHRVLSTTVPEQVTGLLEENPVDAVVLDVMMPMISGLDLLKEIRSQPQWKSLPVLLLSGLGGTEDRVRGIREGADDYLVKPFEPPELVARVERLIERRNDGPGLEGNLESFAPGDLLQNLAHGKKTGCLRVTGESEVAAIHVLHGQIVQATCSGLSGDDAILNLIAMESGHFIFEATSEEAEKRNDRGVRLELNSILLEAAWLEDELARRKEHLPESGRSLRVSSDLPEYTGDYATLPLSDLYIELVEGDGLDRHQLLSLEVAAPLRVLLCLALLIEQGVVTVGEPGSADRPASSGDEAEMAASEPLTAVQRLVTVCRARGHEAKTLHVLILFQPAVWKDLLGFIEAIPPSLLAVDQQQLLDQLNLRGSGTVHLNHSEGSILLNLKPLREDGRVHGGALLALAAGVVIWLSEGTQTEVVSLYAEELEKQQEGSVGVVLLPRTEWQDPVRKLLEDSSYWRTSDQIPRSLDDLARLLA